MEYDKSAFPLYHVTTGLTMTLRDYFAANAMQGLMSKWYVKQNLIPPNYADCIAKQSYEIANAMIEERGKIKEVEE